MFLAQLSYKDIEEYAEGMLYGFYLPLLPNNGNVLSKAETQTFILADLMTKLCFARCARGSPEAALARLVRATNHRRQRIRRLIGASHHGYSATRTLSATGGLPSISSPPRHPLMRQRQRRFSANSADNRWQIAECQNPRCIAASLTVVLCDPQANQLPGALR